MSASPQDVQQQLQAFGGQQPTWQQLQALAVPPPLPQADDATIDALEAQAPQVPDLTKPAAGGPLTPDQQKSVTQDLISRRGKADAAQTELQAQYAQAKADLGDERSALSSLTNAEVGTLSEQPPAPPQQNANPLQRLAPLLFLTAFGGKATKMDANAMLGASIGAVQGYQQGNQEAYDKAVKQYDAAYKRFEDRQKQQTEIFDRLREAYKDRADADLKALQMARTLTEDDGGAKIDQKLLEIQDHYQTAAKSLAESNYRMQKEQYDDRVRLELARRKTAQQGGQISDDDLRTLAQTAIRTGKDPGFGMGQSAVRDRYQAIKAEEINKAGGPDAAVNAGAQTRLTNAEASTLGRQKANLDRVEHALTDTGGIGDQAMAAAKRLNPSNLRTVNRISQLFQREVSDPALADYRLKMLALRDEFATVINRGGQPTEGSRQQATEEMDKFQVNAVPAIVQAIKDTAGANSRALDAEIQQLGRTQSGAKSFATEQDAEKAAAAGQLKSGDRITVNGIQGTWH